MKVKQTHVKDWVVSSVHLSIDHNYGGDRPIHWETYIFEANAKGEITNFSEVWGTRYYDKDAMLAEHDDLVQRIENGWIPSYTED